MIKLFKRNLFYKLIRLLLSCVIQIIMAILIILWPLSYIIRIHNKVDNLLDNLALITVILRTQ